MPDDVKINLTCPRELSADLKKIAKGKGMQFHAYLVGELKKVRDKEVKNGSL